MNPINFNEYRDRILEAITNRGFVFYNKISNTGDYILIDKFISQPIQDQISGNVIIGGPLIPMVSILHVRTGEMRFFAVKALLPGINI